MVNIFYSMEVIDPILNDLSVNGVYGLERGIQTLESGIGIKKMDKDLRIKAKGLGTYEYFNQWLNKGRNKNVRSFGYQTWVERENPHYGDDIFIRLFNTNILTIIKPTRFSIEARTERFRVNTKDLNSINSISWTTATTSRRLNGFFPNGVRVFSQDFKWYWCLNFTDQRRKRRYFRFQDDDLLVMNYYGIPTVYGKDGSEKIEPELSPRTGLPKNAQKVFTYTLAYATEMHNKRFGTNLK